MAERTFQCQDQLPPLPVPSLDETLQRYLKSVQPLVTADEYARTSANVADFRNSVGPKLQAALEDRAKTHKNWLEKWWEDEAYLAMRIPLLPYMNFGGASQNFTAWPPMPGTQLKRGALCIHFVAAYWNSIRKEEVSVMKSRGVPWCMNQTHRMFNSYRRPGHRRDSIQLNFKTEAEGDCPSHIVVLCRGHLWKLPLLNRNGSVVSPSQLEAAFSGIRSASNTPHPHYVGALTCLDRERWAEERSHLISLSAGNADGLAAVEEAAFLVSLTDESPRNDEDLARLSMAGDARVMWADKCLNYMIHANGTLNSCSEHSIVDAVVNVQMCSTTDVNIAKAGWDFQSEPLRDEDKLALEGIEFVTDARINAAVDEAIETMRRNSSSLDVSVGHFTDFGNDFFRSRGVYGDTVVQLAIQLAYMRFHGKAAAVYETGSTRKYWHGRTETVRSATQDSIDFAKAVLASHTSESELQEKLTAAMNRHNLLMAEATDAKGIDRHLMGLRILARDMGFPEPKFFQDPAWTASGGDGNFVLSTSFVGYSDVWGGVAPMMSNGYGCFYKMQGGRISITTSAWLGPEERTDRAAFRDHVDWALRRIHDLLARRPAKPKTKAKI